MSSEPAFPAAIRTLDLTKAYGPILAVDGLSLSVGKGEVFGFLGPNGAGKTTAVKLLVGISRQTAGEAWILEAPAGDVSVRRRIGYLPELFRYQEWLTGREVLQLHARLAQLPSNVRAAAIDRSLELVGLTPRADDRVSTYSKGMQQRLGLGAALLGEPEIVFLDEPTSALDPVGRHDIRQIIRELQTRGTTVFLNSHLLSEVEQVCDRVAVINAGRVIAAGTLDELKDRDRGIRLRLGAFDPSLLDILGEFGSIRREAQTITINGVAAAKTPEIVRLLVDKGIDIQGVEPLASLEESFLNLLQEDPLGYPHYR